MNQKTIRNRLLAGATAALLGFVSVFGFGAETALAEEGVTSVKVVKLTDTLIPGTAEKAPEIGGQYYDEDGDIIVNSLKAMEAVGQIKSVVPEGFEEADPNVFKIYNLDPESNDGPDIMMMILDMGSELGKGISFYVLGSRSMKGSWDLWLNEAALKVAQKPYAQTLDFFFPPEHEHKWGTAFVEGKTGHYHPCLNPACPISDDTKKDGFAAHTYGSWKVLSLATDSKEGARERTCTVCGHKDTQAIPKGQGDGSKLPDPSGGGAGTGTGTGTGQGSGQVTTPASVAGLSVKNPKAKTAIVKWKAVAGADGYEVSYTTDKKFKKGIKKKESKTASLTIKKLKKKKTYYVKVRAFKKDASGKKVYGDYSKAKKVKIKK